MTEALIINQQKILPGAIERFKIPVGKLPSGTRIEITGYVTRAMQEGPTVLLTGGLHGDEINGIEIVRQLITSGTLDRIKCGTVIALPIMNVHGFINFSRDMPDGKDVNRSFPGIQKGSLASRVAYALTHFLLPLADLIIDFHTGGGSRFNHPQVRYTKGHAESKALADSFSAPVTLEKGVIAKSFRKSCIAADKPIIVYEGGEALRLDGTCILHGIQGTQRVLAAKGMLESSPTPSPSTWFTKSRWIRASHSGLFKWIKPSGHFVKKGEKIGGIEDPYGESIAYVTASRDGFIIGHNNNPVVHQGDAIFHVAYR